MLSRAAHIWRIMGSGLGFTLFGLGGLLVSLTIFPIIAGVIREPQRQRVTRRFIQWLFRCFTGYLCRMRIIDLEVRGAEKLAQCKGVVVVSNHPSLIDIILIIAILPDAQCVVKNQLWQNPFLGGVVRSAGYIRNDDDAEAVVLDCVGILQSGGNLLVFPEGTRTREGYGLVRNAGDPHALYIGRRRKSGSGSLYGVSFTPYWRTQHHKIARNNLFETADRWMN